MIGLLITTSFTLLCILWCTSKETVILIEYKEVEEEVVYSITKHNYTLKNTTSNKIDVTAMKTATEVINTNISSSVSFRKFVFCYDYWEQQTNAILSLWSLQKWANLSGNFSVVEPFVRNSFFGSTSDLTKQHHFDKALRFRDYFDIERWTKRTAKYGIPPLVSWSTFTQHTSKEVIVVLLAYNANPGGYYEGDKIKNNRRCKEESQKHMGNINSLLNSLKLKVVKTLCYAYYKKNNNKQLSEFNSLLELERNATILFSFWRGIEPGRITIDEPLLQRQRETDILSMIFPSSKIEHSSRKYLKSTLNVGIQEYTAIVFRAARRQQVLKLSVTKAIESYYKCFSRLPDMLRNLGLKVYLSTDLGRFGDKQSSSITGRKELFQRVLSVVYNGSKTISSYEKEFVTAADGIVDTGYIAEMQKTIALNAKCIIMIGGFSAYQDSIIVHYNTSNRTCIKYLCYGELKDS